ncbi:hypothetical protein HY546_02970 [archaeon]|nr:hypothetical protein [archaeon]
MTSPMRAGPEVTSTIKYGRVVKSIIFPNVLRRLHEYLFYGRARWMGILLAPVTHARVIKTFHISRRNEKPIDSHKLEVKTPVLTEAID